MIRYDVGGCGLPPWQRLNDAVREEGEHACCTKAWDVVVSRWREFCGVLSVRRGMLYADKVHSSFGEGAWAGVCSMCLIEYGNYLETNHST